jgi:hypothetical protein
LKTTKSKNQVTNTFGPRHAGDARVGLAAGWEQNLETDEKAATARGTMIVEPVAMDFGLGLFG